jgi:hypothetical protein
MVTAPAPLLDDAFPMPLDQPFSTAQAQLAGVSKNRLGRLVADGLLRRVLHGVYVATQVRDTLDLRAAALALVVPPGAVVTDRTAGWLLGANMILAPNDHLAVPPVSVFMTTEGHRLRNGICASGERRLAPRDITIVGGIRTTTPLRTACDLGRLLHRDQALAALDSMLRLGVRREEVLVEVGRFRGYRGVVQLRALAPYADPRAQSPGESILRLRWIDAGLPTAEPQLEVAGPRGPYYLDLGVRELRYGAEYFGGEFHTEEDRPHDEARIRWIEDAHDFTIRVLWSHHLFGPRRNAEDVLVEGFLTARRRLGLSTRWLE